MKRIVILIVPLLLTSCFSLTRTETAGSQRAAAQKQQAPKKSDSPPPANADAPPPQEKDPADLQRLGLIASLSVIALGAAYIGYRKWKSKKPADPAPTSP